MTRNQIDEELRAPEILCARRENLRCAEREENKGREQDNTIIAKNSFRQAHIDGIKYYRWPD